MEYSELLKVFKIAILMKKINGFDASEVISQLINHDKTLETILDDILNVSL